MDHRENWIRAATFRSPQWIPCSMKFSPLNMRQCGPDIEKLMREHPRIFPEYDPVTFENFSDLPPVYRKGQLVRDNWGCIWDNAIEGLEGQVVGHPLSDWSALAGWQPPDPIRMGERGPRDWGLLRAAVENRRKRGHLTEGDAERLFDRLYFLRGFENLMMDFAEDRTELDTLIAMLSSYEHKVVDEWIRIGVDVISFHTDIGTQQGLMISPAAFRRHLRPLFEPLLPEDQGGGQHCDALIRWPNSRDHR